MFKCTHTVKYGLGKHNDIVGDFIISTFSHFENLEGAKRFTVKLMREFMNGENKLEYVEASEVNADNRLQKILYQFDSKNGIYSIFTQLSVGDIDQEVFSDFNRAYEFYRNTIKNADEHVQYVVFGYSQDISKSKRLVDIDEYWCRLPKFEEFVKDRWGFTADASMIDQWFNPKYEKKERY